MKRGEQSIGTLSIREFVAIHMMAVVVKKWNPLSRMPDENVFAEQAIRLTDALLEELTKERQAE